MRAFALRNLGLERILLCSMLPTCEVLEWDSSVFFDRFPESKTLHKQNLMLFVGVSTRLESRSSHP